VIAFVVYALARGCKRLRARGALGEIATKIATLLRAKVPRCSTCDKRVERYVVTHERNEPRLHAVAECHGATRVREFHARDAIGRGLFRMADWLRNDPFPLEP
jgi:hypothetical protein